MRAASPPRPLYLEIAAISFAAILLEIAYTRIFSFKITYYFTYLILGVAMLGLGAGAVTVAISARLRAADTQKLVSGLSIACGAAVLAGYFAIARIPLESSRFMSVPLELAKLVAATLVLLVPFLGVGVMLPLILGARPDRLSRLYGLDLAAAALACALVVPLLIQLTPPGCIALSALVFVLGGLRGAGFSRPLLAAGGGLALVLALLALAPRSLPDPVAESIKQIDAARAAGRLVGSEWHPVFRVDVVEHPDAPGSAYLLHHDGMLGSVMRRFDGDLSKLSSFERDTRAVPFSVAPPHPTTLIVGAAGGHEVMASLYFGASRVVGVELNPVTYSLVTQRFADFVGHIAEDPRVRLVNAEARSYLHASDERFDLIWLVAPDSYASMNAASSASFVLSESYLYTVEMIQESLAHLSEHGILAAQFGERDFLHRPTRTLRFLSTARAALEEQGVKDFGAHVLAFAALGLPPLFETTVLVSKSPFSEAQRRAFIERAAPLPAATPGWMPGLAADATPVSAVVALPAAELARWYDQYPYEMHPVRDDSPYFWHFARFRDVFRSPDSPEFRGGDGEILVGEQVMLTLLGVAATFAFMFLLLPLWATRSAWREMRFKTRSALCFAGLGAGFMLLEVCLLQRFTLFLGYPTYSLSVTLFALLLFSGLGSFASAWLAARGNAAVLGSLAGIALVLAVHAFAAPRIFAALGGAALPLRVLAAVALIAPLGLCLGTFMPIALGRIAALGSHEREYVAWAWALNGFFSVIASIASTIIAMLVGFTLLLGIAFAVYVAAALALLSIPSTRAPTSP